MENSDSPDQTSDGNSPKTDLVKPPKRICDSAHGSKDRVKPYNRVGKYKAKAFKTLGSIDTAIYKRICSQLSKRWPINAKEVSLICGIALHLSVIGKRTTNKEELFRWLGFRVASAIRKQIKWLETLSDKGFLLRIRFEAGEVSRRGHGYGLTEYGQAFINDLDREYDKARQWVNDQKRYSDIVIYLDRVKEQLHPRQRALFTEKQIEQLKAIGKI